MFLNEYESLEFYNGNIITTISIILVGLLLILEKSFDNFLLNPLVNVTSLTINCRMSVLMV